MSQIKRTFTLSDKTIKDLRQFIIKEHGDIQKGNLSEYVEKSINLMINLKKNINCPHCQGPIHLK